MTTAAWLVLYMLAMTAAAIAVHLSPHCDLRGVGRLRRHAPTPARDEEDFDAGAVARELYALRRESAIRGRLEVVPRADVVVAITLGGAAGLLVWAFAGAAAPLLVANGVFAPVLDAPLGASLIERLAQVVGALAAVAIGVRLFRATLAIGVVAALLGFALLAAQIVMGGALAPY